MQMDRHLAEKIIKIYEQEKTLDEEKIQIKSRLNEYYWPNVIMLAMKYMMTEIPKQ